MIKNLQIYLQKNNSLRKIIINISSLFSIQILSYLLPLITTPYLNRVLGLENIGILSFSAAFIGYFTILTEFGFNFTGIRLISINKDFPEKVTEIFNSITVIKLFLFILSFITICFLVYFIKMFKDYYLIYLYLAGTILANILMSNWFYQGMQEMKFLTIYTLISKSFYTIFIFFIVRSKNDFYNLSLLNFSTSFLVGLYSYFYIKKKYSIKFYFPDFKILKIYFLESVHIFLSNIFISIYTISTTFILGLFTDYKQVGIYSSADKIIQIFKSLTTPISESIYPEAAIRFKKNINYGLSFIYKASKAIIFVSLFTSLFSFIFAEKIILFLFGNEFIDSINILKIMSFIPLYVSLSNICGIQIMLNINLKKQFTIIILIVSFVSITSNLIFVKLYKSLATAIIVQSSELLIFLVMLIFLYNYFYTKKRIKNVF